MKMQPKRVQKTANNDAKFSATKNRIDVEQAKINIKMLYALRTVATEKEGILWYSKYSQECSELAKINGVSFEQFCALVSVLSPMTAWVQNIEMAVEAIEQYNIAGYVQVHMFSNNNLKAAKILSGDLDVFNPSTAPKTYNFYNNLVNCNDANFVTIDSHAFAILFGMYNVSGGWLSNYAAYKVAAQCYTEVAEELDILPCVLQAVCWTTRKSIMKNGNRITSNDYADANNL